MIMNDKTDKKKESSEKKDKEVPKTQSEIFEQTNHDALFGHMNEEVEVEEEEAGQEEE